MLLCEKEKTILEIEAQHAINYLNILVITTISLAVSIWISNETILKTLEIKFLSTLVLLGMFVYFILKIYDILNNTKIKIRLL